MVEAAHFARQSRRAHWLRKTTRRAARGCRGGGAAAVGQSFTGTEVGVTLAGGGPGSHSLPVK